MSGESSRGYLLRGMTLITVMQVPPYRACVKRLDDSIGMAFEPGLYRLRRRIGIANTLNEVC
jgi:hypothetical protein